MLKYRILRIEQGCICGFFSFKRPIYLFLYDFYIYFCTVASITLPFFRQKRFQNGSVFGVYDVNPYLANFDSTVVEHAL